MARINASSRTCWSVITALSLYGARINIDSKSCAEFIARIAREKFDVEDGSLAELIEWAHIIDGALYESPAQCVELRSSALKLMQVIEVFSSLKVTKISFEELGPDDGA